MLNDLRYGFRTLLKSPGFTLVAVLKLVVQHGMMLTLDRCGRGPGSFLCFNSSPFELAFWSHSHGSDNLRRGLSASGWSGVVGLLHSRLARHKSRSRGGATL